MARIPGFHPGGPGSIPGVGEKTFFPSFYFSQKKDDITLIKVVFFSKGFKISRLWTAKEGLTYLNSIGLHIPPSLSKNGNIKRTQKEWVMLDKRGKVG